MSQASYAQVIFTTLTRFKSLRNYRLTKNSFDQFTELGDAHIIGTAWTLVRPEGVCENSPRTL